MINEARAPLWEKDGIAIHAAETADDIRGYLQSQPTTALYRFAAHDIITPTYTRIPAPFDTLADGYASKRDEYHLYAVTFEGAFAAFIFHDPVGNMLFNIETVGLPPRQHPHFGAIHYAYLRLAMLLSAGVAVDPTTSHIPYLVSRRGERMEPVYANAADAAYGTITLHEDATLSELDYVLGRVGLVVDVTRLPQHMLDTIRHAKASIYSEAEHLLLRHLRQAFHLILPRARMAMLPALAVLDGSLIARQANYLDIRHLAHVFDRIQLNKMQFADFPALTTLGGPLDLPMARNIALPVLRGLNGTITTPSRATIYAPRLPAFDRCNANRPIPMLEEQETPPVPDNLVFLNAS